jgi:hypothetical protein
MLAAFNSFSPAFFEPKDVFHRYCTVDLEDRIFAAPAMVEFLMLCIAMVVGPLRLAWEGGTVVTLWLHCCHAVVMLCNTVVTLLLHCCHSVLDTAAKLLLRR